MGPFDCMDCGINTSTIHEYYMVLDSVWLYANPDDDGMLCIGCLENRLGRVLDVRDFSNYPINFVFEQSERLRSRIYGEQIKVEVS